MIWLAFLLEVMFGGATEIKWSDKAVNDFNKIGSLIAFAKKQTWIGYALHVEVNKLSEPVTECVFFSAGGGFCIFVG